MYTEKIKIKVFKLPFRTIIDNIKIPDILDKPVVTRTSSELDILIQPLHIVRILQQVQQMKHQPAVFVD